LSGFFPASTVEFIARIKSQPRGSTNIFFQRINALYTGLNFSAKCNQELTYISKQIQ